MKKKTMISGVLCLSLLGTAACAINPAKPEPPAQTSVTTPAAPAADLDAPAVMPEEKMPYSIGVYATVNEVLNDNGQISLEVKVRDGDTLILHLSDATILLDAQQAIPVGVENIKAGDEIYAYHDVMMTMSIPAQTPALAILVNLGEDGMVPQLHMPESIQRTAEGVEILNDHGSIIVRMDEKTVFTPYRTRQIVTADDLHIGQPYLAWYDVVMESYPAQAYATRVMILPADLEERELSFVVDGDMVIEAKMVDGTVVVPVRTAAEALGHKVGYRKADGKEYVTIEGKDGVLSMTVGEDLYNYKAAGAKDAEPVSFGAAVRLAPDMSGKQVTWMSAEAFHLLGYDVALTDGALTITKK